MDRRVLITKSFVNICTMQVCARKEVEDTEILAVCNELNPSGTQGGWTEVLRVADEASAFKTRNKLPVQCIHDEQRMHYFVLC